METLNQEITRTSSKGQIVIPTKIRRKLSIKKGSLFYITSKNGLIILKRLAAGINKADLKTLRNVGEAWRDIEHGRYRIYPKDSFSKELAKW